MTDDVNNNFNAAAGGDAPKGLVLENSSYESVVALRDSSPEGSSIRQIAQEAVEKMDAIMQEIDDKMFEALENEFDKTEQYDAIFSAIQHYGTEPMNVLRQTSEESIKVQETFDSQVRVFQKDITSMESIVEEAKKIGVQVAQTAAKLGKGGFKLVNKVVGSVLGALNLKENKSDEEKMLDDVKKQLREKQMTIFKMADQLEATENSMEAVRKEADRLGKAAMDAKSDIDYYLCAATELRRRFVENYLPAADRLLGEAKSDPNRELRVEQFNEAYLELEGRLTALKGNRLQSVTSAMQIKTMMTGLRTQKRKLSNMRTNSVNDWTNLLSQTGISATMMTIQVIINKGDKIGVDLMKQLDQNLTATQRMMLESAKQKGSVPSQLLIEVSQNTQKRAKEMADLTKNNLEQWKKDSAAYDTQTAKVLDSIRDISAGKLLESAKIMTQTAKQDMKAKKPAAKAAPVAPANDDGAPKADSRKRFDNIGGGDTGPG